MAAEPAALGLLQRLRVETADCHQRLEDSLDILAEPLSRARFTHVLERFWGFHAAWEPAVARALGGDAFLHGRSKLDCLRADLAALGRGPADIDRLPLCPEAPSLVLTPAAAVGSVYVLEGSTLGGQVISRALKAAPWLPAAGLTYFHPYGERTGEMWRAFRQYALGHAGPATDDAMVAAARATFERLQAWLA